MTTDTEVKPVNISDARHTVNLSLSTSTSTVFCFCFHRIVTKQYESCIMGSPIICVGFDTNA